MQERQKHHPKTTRNNRTGAGLDAKPQELTVEFKIRCRNSKTSPMTPETTIQVQDHQKQPYKCESRCNTTSSPYKFKRTTKKTPRTIRNNHISAMLNAGPPELTVEFKIRFRVWRFTVMLERVRVHGPDSN